MGMTYEQAAAKAKKSGGSPAWGQEQGWYVMSGQSAPAFDVRSPMPLDYKLPSAPSQPPSNQPSPYQTPSGTREYWQEQNIGRTLPGMTTWAEGSTQLPGGGWTPSPQQYTPPQTTPNWMEGAQDFIGNIIGGTPAYAATQPQSPYQTPSPPAFDVRSPMPLTGQQAPQPGVSPPPEQPYPAEPVGGGMRFPGQTPPGVGFIAPWTEQARYTDPTTGQYKYTQQEGAPEQIAAGEKYGQLPQGTAESGTSSAWNNPQDIPPELLQEYDWEWFNYEDPLLGSTPMVRLKAKASMTPYQEWQTQQGQGEQTLPTYPKPMGDEPSDPYGRKAWWNIRLSGWEYPPDWGVDPATLESGYAPPGTEPQWKPGEFGLEEQALAQQEAQQQAQQQYQQQQLEWQQQQFQQQLGFQEQARLAALAAQPQSWMQYHALEGTQPQVQPWMLPLMSQQYPELQAGMGIPGWATGQEGGQPMTGLPELLNPSAQYLSRMGPQNLAQYSGYQQARTGAIPEQTNWMQQQLAPGGWGGGLQYTR